MNPGRRISVAILSLVAIQGHGDNGRIEISQDMMPLTISEPGSYVAVENLVHAQSGDGITITANSVTLDLNGYRLFGGAGTVSDDGISIPYGHNIEIRNGTIKGFGDNGIDALFSTNTVFRRLRVMDNYDAGILAGTACSILETVSSRNGVRQGRSGVGVGIEVDIGSMIIDCTVSANYDHGMVVSSGSAVMNCTLAGNGHDGAHGGLGTLFRNIIAFENIGEAFEANGGSVVAECVVLRNIDDGIKAASEGRLLLVRCLATDTANLIAGKGDGIKGQNGSLVLECTVRENYDDGITVGSGAFVYDCLGTGNGYGEDDSPGGGVRMTGPQEGVDSRCDDNHLLNNARGAEAGVNCLVVKNSADGNIIDYAVSSRAHEDITSANPNNAGPWASFDY